MRLKVVRAVLRTFVHRMTAAATAARRRDEDTLERLAELSVEDAVDDGVHCAVDVAEPREDGEDDRRDTVPAEGAEDVDGEEGDPTDEEDAHDDPQSDGRLVVRLSVSARREAGPTERPRRTRLSRPGGISGRRGVKGRGRGLRQGCCCMGAVAIGALDALCVASGVAVHLEVNDRHSDARHVKADRRRENCVERVQFKDAVRLRFWDLGQRLNRLDGGRGVASVLFLAVDSRWVLVQPVPSEVNGKEGDEGGQCPDDSDRNEGSPGRHPAFVVQRVADMYVSVEADGAEAEDGRRRAHDVRRHPEVAEDRSEDPSTEDVVDHGKRHHGNGDQHVGDRQGDEEVVARLAKMAIRRYGNDDEEISGECEDDEQREEKSEDDASCQLEWPRPPVRRGFGGRVVPPISIGR